MLLSGCTLPRRLYSTARLRELESLAERRGITGPELMERAGQAAWQLLQALWPEARRLLVLCGGGNNGGDALVLARLAREAGRHVQVLSLVVSLVDGAPRGDAAQAARRWREAGGAVEAWDPGKLKDNDLVVDGLLGIGLEREVRAPFAEVIEAVRASARPVLALDLPSGLHADTGRVMGTAPAAEATLTFLGLKPGLFTGLGAEYAGTIYCSELMLPAALYREVPPDCGRLELQVLEGLLPPRRRAAHKGDFGHVLVVGGAAGYSGAVALAAAAAARCGAGLVSALLLDRPALTGVTPEVMMHILRRGAAAPAALLERAGVLAVGPGLGRAPRACALLHQLLAHGSDRGLPGVLDADALNLLAREQEPTPKGREGAWVYTPHPGEAARLLGWRTERVQEDRLAAARALHDRLGGTVVLKGAGTLVADETGLDLCATANPGLAAGGTGDVLTGMIAALLAQGLARPAAARLGVCLHAAAAAAAAAEGGERGLQASDLLPWMRRLVNPEPGSPGLRR